ncbi:MAG: PAS domain S-box protein [Verrucomicrobiota bacterium]
MNNLPADKNRRVLVIDDNPAIHDDFRKILSPDTGATAALDRAGAELFGSTAKGVSRVRYETDSAYQGAEGVRRVAQARAAGRPYALAFVDIRMPPGEDGVETTRQIWAVDPEIQIVLCTAYADYSWDEMFEKIGNGDNLVILKKPFDTVEALQLAHALTEKWWLHQQSRRKMAELELRVTERTRELQQTNDALQQEVAEHQRTEETLRLLGSAVEQAQESILITDAELDLPGPRIVFVNPAFTQMTGYSAAEAIGQTPRILQGPRTDRAVMDRLRQNLERGEAFAGEAINYRQDGTEFDNAWQIAPLRNAGGKITHFVALQRDITERKRAGDKLARTEELYRRAIASAGAVPYSLDFKTRSYAFMGEGIAALIGYAPHEVSGRLWQQIIEESVLLGETAGLTKAEAARRVTTGEICNWQCDMRVRTRDGRSRWLSDTSVQNLDALGRPTGAMGILQDITGRKQAETSALAFAKLGRQLSSATTWREAFDFIKDISKTLFNWDAFWIKLYDAKSDSLHSQIIIDTIAGQPVTEERNAPEPPTGLYRRIMAQGGELILRAQPTTLIPGTVPFGDAARPSAALMFVPIHSRGHVVGVLSVQSYTPQAYQEPDVKILQALADQSGGTFDRIWADAALRQSEARLFQSQKLETVGKLAGGIAHEFNSILTTIIGQCEFLLGDLPAGTPLARHASEISSAAAQAATLTRQLLAYGRKQLLQPETLDLNQILAGLAGMFRSLLDDTVETRILPGAALHTVKADASQLEQVIMNLVVNAREAMPHGGRLTLATANVALDRAGGESIPELPPGDYVMLAITDTGTGMSPEVRGRVFEPFFTTKGVGQGSGLGLSTSYGIIQQSGGHITVESTPGRGSTFKIYLPRVDSLTPIHRTRPDAPEMPPGTETILLVETDPALREMAAALLGRLGYTVLAAANGLDALKLQPQRGQRPVDVLFTEVVLPHLSGPELADRVRAQSPSTRILFTSAYSANTVVHPGACLLPKPFTPSALARKLREVLDQPGEPEPNPAQQTFGFTRPPMG